MKTLAVIASLGLASSIMASASLAADDTIDEGRIPMIGMEGPETDACPGIGRIAMFAPKKGDFMRVYPGANEAGPVKDKLPLSTLVWLCEADEEWQGIVYPMGENQDLGDCRVSSNISEPEPYNGPCRYGWVKAKYLEIVAG